MPSAVFCPAPLRRLTQLLLGLAFFVQVQPGCAAELFPMHAEYRASYRAGIPIPATAVRELKRQPNGSWRFEFNVHSFFLDLNESSVLHWRDQWVIPQTYRFKRSGWVRTRKAELDFDWDHLSVRNNVQNKPWHMDIEPQVQDKLSYQVQLHMDLMDGKKRMVYKVADGGILKDFVFEVKGEEKLDTKLGKVDTVYVDKIREPEAKRYTRLWYAKDYRYLLVKMIQREEDGEVYEIELVKAVLDGKEVPAPRPSASVR